MSLLALASTLLSPQTVNYYAWVNQTPDETGVLVDTYAPVQRIRAHWHPMRASQMRERGLDFNKSWATLHLGRDTQLLDVATTADEFGFGGRRWASAPGYIDWRDVDGWRILTLVDVGPDL